MSGAKYVASGAAIAKDPRVRVTTDVYASAIGGEGGVVGYAAFTWTWYDANGDRWEPNQGFRDCAFTADSVGYS